MAAGNSRDLNVNLVGKSDKLKFDSGGSRTVAAGVAIGILLSKGIQGAIEGAVAVATDAISQFLDREDASASLQASLGLDPASAARYGEIAADSYSQGWGNSIGDVGNTVTSLISSFGEGLGGDAGIENLTNQALALADVFGVDVATAINSASVLFTSGLVDDGQEAFDLLTAGMQQMPMALRGELLDASEEYSQFFSSIGISGEEAFGLLVGASADGQYGIDKMGDAIKEFTIRSTDMSALSGSAFEAMGLDMESSAADLLAGGDTARSAFDSIIDGLLGIEDPVEQANAAIALFGTPLEDLGTGEIPQFLAGLQSMDDTLQNVEGSAQEMADTIGGTTRAKFEAFKRMAMGKVVDGLARAFEVLQPIMAEFIPKATKKLGEAFGWLKTSVIEPLSEIWEEHGEKIKRFVTDVFGFAKRGIGRFADDIKNLVQVVKAIFDGDWPAVWENAKKIFVTAWEQIADFGKTFGPRILDGLGDLGSLLVGKGKELIDGLWQGIQKEWDDPVLPWIKDLPNLALKGLGMLGEFLVAKGKELLGGLWKGIQAVWDDPILPWLKSLPGLALKGLGALSGFLVDKGAELLGGLGKGITNVWDDTIIPWLKSLPGKALLAVPALFKTIYSRGKQLLNGLMNGIKDVWNSTVKPWLADMGNKALLAVPALFQTIYSRGKQLLNGLMNGVKDVWNGTVKPWLADMGNKALLAVPALYETIRSRGKQLLNGLMNGVKDVWSGTVLPWLQGLGTRALLAVPGLLESIKSRGKQLMNGLKNGITETWGGIASWLGGIPGRISGFFSGAGSWLSSAGRSIVTGLWNGFIGGVNSLIPGWARGFLGIGGATAVIPGTLGSSANLPPPLPGSSGGGGGGGPLYAHDGGVVPGPLGKEVLAILQAGEEVIPINGNTRTAGGDTFYVTVNMPPGSNGDDVVRALREYQRRSGPVPIKTRAS